VHASQAMLTII